ncbi:MAG: CRISPR-associated endonuclease Cas3'' [Planctomycetota bacterium]
MFDAHSENSQGKPQLLANHLCGVAQRASDFAECFGGFDEARLAGLLHDLGKFRDEFQEYLKKKRSKSIETHHAVYGSALAFKMEWCSTAFAIAGHHAGLHDCGDLQNLVSNPKYKTEERLPRLVKRFETLVEPVPAKAEPPLFASSNEWAIEFYTRMIFSCLVDADYLDTEEHYQGARNLSVSLTEINDDLLARISAKRKTFSVDGAVNSIRNAVFERCIESAMQPQGFFSLTVPTGGGKTLSGMAFALAHAKAHGLRRVIVVIPFLSIIEQNVGEYRRVLDPFNNGMFVEHHSSVSVGERAENEPPSPAELATENWDAPIIVTTSVQFIESLFASSPSKCRKLHNVAGSVVILDEVQTLPTHLLQPLLSVLRELKENYGVTFVFSTATQPAFKYSQFLKDGFKAGEVTEITHDTAVAFKILQRVDYQRAGPWDWTTLAQKIADEPQALCIVNVRKHAFELWEELRGRLSKAEHNGIFHLSSAMCAEHRTEVLGDIIQPGRNSIRWRLFWGEPCRVISTQVVEAGVDLDFPVVFRAMGPLDSIVQAAGRCNREGKLRDEAGNAKHGRVTIFQIEGAAVPPGIYKTATANTAALLENIPLASLAVDTHLFERYFSSLFQLTQTDREKIQDDRMMLRFRTVSAKAKVIEDAGQPVIVPYGRGKELIEEIRNRSLQKGQQRFSRNDLRGLQRFMVNVRKKDFLLYEAQKVITPLLHGLELFVLEEGCYHPSLGIVIENRPTEDFVQ